MHVNKSELNSNDVLNNQNITIRMQEKAADPTKRAYSPSEKFETMLIKNPALLNLKNRLGMELDY